MAFGYTGLMTVLRADALLFDREDVRRCFQLFDVPVTESEITAILKESIGHPLGVAVTARCMAEGRSFGPDVVADAFREIFLYFETAIYRRFDLLIRRFLLELAPFESLDLEMAPDGKRQSPCRGAVGLAAAQHDHVPLRRYPAFSFLV